MWIVVVWSAGSPGTSATNDPMSAHTPPNTTTLRVAGGPPQSLEPCCPTMLRPRGSGRDHRNRHRHPAKRHCRVDRARAIAAGPSEHGVHAA